MSRKNFENLENFSAFPERFDKILDNRSQTSVAKRLKVSQHTISAWLRGEIPKQFKILYRLAKEFNVDLHWLITGENKESEFDIPDAELDKWLKNFAAEIKRCYGPKRKE